MIKIDEKGVTLTVLVITIIVLLMLTTIAITSGNASIKLAKFKEFENELKLLQVKVNEINSKDESFMVGASLTEAQQEIFNNETISAIIFKDKTEEEKENIQESFRYCVAACIQDQLKLDGVQRNYFISIQYGYIIAERGFEYNGVTYYMTQQMKDGVYNVEYKDKNPNSGNFDVSYTKEDDKWKIEVSNIEYDGYISKWKVIYKLEDDLDWSDADGLSFYVTEPGNYYVQVMFKNEFSIGTKTITISE